MNAFFLHPYNITRDSPGELEAAQSAFGTDNVSTSVADIPAGSLVVPRFRALPFGRELETEVTAHGSTLVNSYSAHRRIADIFAYCPLLEGITPAVYTLEDMPYLPEGAYFVKGETNSLKNQWFTSAFAPNKRAVLDIASRLSGDLVTGSQRIAIRPFQPYRKLCEAVDGRPVFNERRVFTFNGQVLSDGFYWSSFVDEVGEVSSLVPGEYEKTLSEALDRLSGYVPFVVIDLAECEDGTWQVVELNDGSMSGLSENDPATLWSNFVKLV